MAQQESALLTIASKWATPAGLTIMFGAIVWGVQLNFAIINLTDKLGEIDAEADVSQRTQRDIAATVLKATLMMDEMEKDVLAVVKHVNDHNKESAEWKQRILILEERLRRANMGSRE